MSRMEHEKPVEKSSELAESKKPMSALAEASLLIRGLSEPCPAGDKVKAAQGRVARKLNGRSWTANRIREVWKADRRLSISGEEIDELRAAMRAQKEAAGAREFEELRSRLVRVEAALARYEDRVGAGADLGG
jgi:hypothetical protein